MISCHYVHEARHGYSWLTGDTNFRELFLLKRRCCHCGESLFMKSGYECPSSRHPEDAREEDDVKWRTYWPCIYDEEFRFGEHDDDEMLEPSHEWAHLCEPCGDLYLSLSAMGFETIQMCTMRKDWDEYIRKFRLPSHRFRKEEHVPEGVQY